MPHGVGELFYSSGDRGARRHPRKIIMFVEIRCHLGRKGVGYSMK